MNLSYMLRAFQHRNYRLYFSGQIVSLVGTWMQRVALSWLVYRLTESAFLLGLVGFVTQFPSLAFLPLTGAIADSRDRRKLLIGSQVLAMLQAAALAALVMTGSTVIWAVMVLGFIGGIAFAIEAPARQALVVQLVSKKEDLANAIALNSATFNIARLIGPSLAGVVVAMSSEGPAFAINSASYLAVIAALFMLRLQPQPRGSHPGGMMAGMKEGLVYAFSRPAMRFMLVHLAVLSLIPMSYLVLLPIYAKEILGGDARTLGFLMGAVGMGALAGVVWISSRKHIGTLWRLLPWSSAMLGAGLVLLAGSSRFLLSEIILPLTGFGMMTTVTGCNTMLQHIVDEGMRGRVMSLFTLAVMGTLPLGSLFIGWFAEVFSTQDATLLGAAFAFWFALYANRRTKAMNPFEACPGTPCEPPVSSGVER
jgi:MFS family permease